MPVARRILLLSLALALMLPATAFAQGAFAGIVRDGSGGVLPGVTVEASSPALIEGTRSVVTDGTGPPPRRLHDHVLIGRIFDRPP